MWGSFSDSGNRRVVVSASRESRDDADLVAGFQRRALLLEETDVFFIHVDQHGATYLATIIHNAITYPVEAPVELVDGPCYRIRLHVKQVRAVAITAESGRNADDDWHRL